MSVPNSTLILICMLFLYKKFISINFIVRLVVLINYFTIKLCILTIKTHYKYIESYKETMET